MRTFPLVWDSTMLAALRSCHHLVDLEYMQHFKPKGTNVNLHAGGAYAEGIKRAREAWYVESRPQDECVALGIGALIESYGDFECPDNSPKTCDRMCGALEFYCSEYPFATDPMQIILLGDTHAIEFRFAIPLPIKHPDTDEPLILAGRFDAVGEFAGGEYCVDDKTTKALGESWANQWDMRGQFCGYAWALREHGRKPAGTIVQGLGILKTKYTQQRVIVAQPDWKLDEWYMDTLADIEEAKERYVSGARWRKIWNDSCNAYGGCSFKETCLVEDPRPWLESNYEIRVWNPLER